MKVPSPAPGWTALKRRDSSGSAAGTVGSQLVANPIEPAVPITAQKSVILTIRAY